MNTVENKKEAAAKAMKKYNKKKKKIFDIFGYKFWIGGTIGGLFALFFFSFFSPNLPFSENKVNDKKIIDEINYQSKTFKVASTPFFDNKTIKEAKGFIGKSFISNREEAISVCIVSTKEDQPHYDIREEYPLCYTDYEVYNTKDCAGSFAVAAISAFRDCLCVVDDVHMKDTHLSVQQGISCIDNQINCVDGGFIDVMYSYMSTTPITTSQCFPFTAENTPCSDMCQNPHTIQPNFVCKAFTVSDIKRQVKRYGPVVMNIPIYSDFLVYSSGVYKPMKTSVALSFNSQTPLMQAVKIIGWGTQDNNDYWIIENSWGASWGENGYAKIDIQEFEKFNQAAYVIIPQSTVEFRDIVKEQEDARKAAEEKKKEEEEVGDEQNINVVEEVKDNEEEGYEKNENIEYIYKSSNNVEGEGREEEEEEVEEEEVEEDEFDEASFLKILEEFEKEGNENVEEN